MEAREGQAFNVNRIQRLIWLTGYVKGKEGINIELKYKNENYPKSQLHLFQKRMILFWDAYVVTSIHGAYMEKRTKCSNYRWD